MARNGKEVTRAVFSALDPYQKVLPPDDLHVNVVTNRSIDLENCFLLPRAVG